MAIAAHQERPQTGVSPFADGFSNAASSMASVFPHQVLFHHSSCKGAASMSTTVFPMKAMDCSPPETEDVCGFEDNCQPLMLQCTPVQSIGAGLANLGNTCFLNSVLQCLTYTPPLAAHLRAGLHNTSCNIKGFCAMCALERHVRDALSSTGRIVSPSYLVKNLRSISRSFQLWRQEDAHEYMRYLIEALQKCCSVDILGNRSFINGVFGGRLRSQVKCTQCSHCSNKYDPFLDLSLEVNRADSLNKALAHFTAIEVLDGDNKYHCSKCKTKVRAYKQFTIDRAPHILTVQLKRFSSSGSYGGKIDKKVHFERNLDLTPFVTEAEDAKLSYSLYAVLVHSGWSMNSGHYYCFVRTAADTWHAMDDSEVSQVSESTVLAQKAYILFYIRNASSNRSSETNFLIENPNYATMSSPQITSNHEENSDSVEVSENKSSFSSDSDHQNDNTGDSAPAEQVARCSEAHDRHCQSPSKQMDEKLPCFGASGSDEGQHCFSSIEKESSSHIVKDMDVESLIDSCGESWYRAVLIMKNPSTNLRNCIEVQAGESDSSVHEVEFKEDSCAKAQSRCADNLCGSVMAEASSSHFSDSTNTAANSEYTYPGADSDDVPTPKSYSQLRRPCFFDFVSPILRTARFETAGHHALNILCMCAKYCFWSCFWPPL